MSRRCRAESKSGFLILLSEKVNSFGLALINFNDSQMKRILCALALFPAITAIAQNQEVTFKVKAGSFIRDVVPANEIFSYPAFSVGTVTFKSGVATSGLLNYNMLLAQMQFINGAADTLSLANEETIDHISIGDDVFYYEGGYYRQITAGAAAILVERVSFNQYTEKQASNSISSSTSAVSNYGFILERKAYTLAPAEDLLLVKKFEYAILDHKHSLIYPDRRKLIKAFSKNKAEVTNYLNYHSADPGNQEELHRLVRFLGDLK
jgi:hypothetical protein